MGTAHCRRSTEGRDGPTGYELPSLTKYPSLHRHESCQLRPEMEGQDLFPLVSVPSLFTQLLRRWGQEGSVLQRGFKASPGT